MKSKKKLFEHLSLYFMTDRFVKRGLKAEGISNETYGRKSCIYIDTKDAAERKNLEGFLSTHGFLVNRNYWPGSGTLEVQVSYFKGNQWDE
jgi:hypothetical protein